MDWESTTKGCKGPETPEATEEDVPKGPTGWHHFRSVKRSKHSCLSNTPAISGKEKRKNYNIGSHVQGHSWKSNYLSYKGEFKITKDKTWPSIKSLKSKIANQSQSREINQYSNGFWANLSFMLFVFKINRIQKATIYYFFWWVLSKAQKGKRYTMWRPLFKMALLKTLVSAPRIWTFSQIKLLLN